MVYTFILNTFYKTLIINSDYKQFSSINALREVVTLCDNTITNCSHVFYLVKIK